MKLSVFFTCILILLGTACKDSGTSYEGTYLGAFKYSAYDTSGTLVSSGAFYLFRNGSELLGPWELADGRSGELKGSIQNDTVRVDLFPTFRDHNLYLNGVLSGNSIVGTWILIGFPGEMARGSFTAIKE